MDLQTLMRRMRAELEPECGPGESRAIVRLVLHSLKGWSATDLVVHADSEVSPFLQSEVGKVMDRLRAGEPVQYVLGEARFYGLDLHVDRRVLIPRPETEELVDMIVRENDSADLRVLDIGTGSGAIAVALARNLRFARVTAIDVSPGALEVARDNARRLRVDVTFLEEDIFQWMPPKGSFDILVSNPPYIPEEEKGGMERNVLEHEPAGALFVPDDDPLLYYRRIAEVGREALVSGGRIYLEVNPRFATEVGQELALCGFDKIEVVRDISRKERFLKARQR